MNRITPSYFVRVDRATETGEMFSINASLSDRLSFFDELLDSIIYSLLTSNKIERFWRDLYYILEMYFKEQLRTLLERNEYNPHNLTI